MELTIEEKAKAYDDVLERVKTLYEKSNGISNGPIFKKWLEEDFPELAESEDEKIRKSLIEHFTNYEVCTADGTEAKDVLAWLEKQDAQTIKEALRTEYEKGRADAIAEFEKQGEWSEEDERMYQSALWHIKNSCGNQGKTSGEFEVYN